MGIVRMVVIARKSSVCRMASGRTEHENSTEGMSTQCCGTRRTARVRHTLVKVHVEKFVTCIRHFILAIHAIAGRLAKHSRLSAAYVSLVSFSSRSIWNSFSCNQVIKHNSTYIEHFRFFAIWLCVASTIAKSSADLCPLESTTTTTTSANETISQQMRLCSCESTIRIYW